MSFGGRQDCEEFASAKVWRSLDLARLWHEQGRLEDAEAEDRAVMTARLRILGEDHPRTLRSRHDLASVLSQQGRREQAEAEYRAVLHAQCRVLGEDHPDTLATITAVATIAG